MNSYDHYAEAKSIADQIEAVGFAEEASAVRDAIDTGFSGTEIFMKLRFHLSPLQKNTKIDSAARSRIAVLVNKIDAALR